MARTNGTPGTLRVAVWLALVVAGNAAAQAPSPDQLVEMSLEELGDIEVTSVSRRAQRLSEAAASVFVITAEDIRRAGATTLPEALRLAPNLDVARVNATSYAIAARGFNNAIGNKLQVLLDGRILYSPLFSGMFWDAHELALRDIERIEVVSGPGATLWGANAVTGVINIISRPAGDTRGGSVRLGAGSDERHVTVRYGAGEATRALRVSARVAERDETRRSDGTPQHDAFRGTQLGLRGDWGGERDRITVSAAAFRGDADSRLPADLRTSSAFVSAQWTRQLANEGRVRVQGYLDQRHRDIPGSIRQDLRIADLEFQHDVGGLERHALAWGASHRVARDDIDNTPRLAFLPARRQLRWTSLYVQDEIALRDGRVRVTGGLRLEHNSYTGLEVLPTLRWAWTPRPDQLVWASATRAVRTPSRFDRELFSPAQPPYMLAGGPDFVSEVAEVVELGWRAQPSARASVSVTVFHHRYDRLRSFELRPDGTYVIANAMAGRGTGLEAWGSLQATPRWRLSAGVALLDQDLHLRAGSTDPTGVASAGNDPHHQWRLRSSLDLPHGVELDVGLRHVGARPAPHVPAWSALDVRLGWRPRPELELSLAARNLGGDHVEFGNPATATEFEPSAHASLRWTF